MKNLKMLIEYDGTDFYGWQYQPDKRTVQGEIESALKKITNEEINLIGAGRTDHGVHALGQVANFHTCSRLTIEQIKKGINSLVGHDIYVKLVEEVVTQFNSRFSAKSKMYQYNIILEPMVFKLRYSWFVKYNLNLSIMEKAMPFLLTEQDFKGFAIRNGDKNTVCKILNLNLTRDDSQIIIKIEADRFLRKMVRGIVGFMVDVGRGRFSPDDVADVFSGKIKDLYFAPAHGLCLMEVQY